MFSIHDETDFVERVFQGGALGYVTKSSAAGELREAVAAVSAGRRFLSADLAPELEQKTSRE